jgi:hypothetical protein
MSDSDGTGPEAFPGVPAEGYEGLEVPSWTALIARVEADATHGQSRMHGFQHWRAVALAGVVLCNLVPEADPTAVMLFALLHNSMRLDDEIRLRARQRAAAYIRKLATERDLIVGAIST